MALSPHEAAAALRDIGQARTRSARAYGYQQASPNLILWGVLWAVGYGLTDALPYRALPIWIAVDAIGLATSIAIGVRSRARSDPARRLAIEPGRTAGWASPQWGFPAALLIAFTFIAAAIAVMSPVSGRQIGAFVPLVVAASYALAGIWIGLRFVVTGAVIAALTLIGFFLLPTHFFLWMAGVGGGALVLAGVWLRKV
jgi:hypothetical protein